MIKSNLILGQGLSSRALVNSGRLVLGGVIIPSGMGGVSGADGDGDVITCAIVEAMLKAFDLGSLVEVLPSYPNEKKHLESRAVLRLIYAKVRALGGEVECVDVILLASGVLLARHLPDIKARLAEDMNIDSLQLKISLADGDLMSVLARENVISAIASVGLIKQPLSLVDLK